MAPLRFRAWDKATQQMIPNDFTVRIAESGVVYFKRGGTTYSLDAIEIMQSTGLTDRNAKEIFEGDIIESDRSLVDGSPDRRVVEWDAGECCFHPFSCGDACGCCSARLYSDRVSVIGNIYENPELLN